MSTRFKNYLLNLLAEDKLIDVVNALLLDALDLLPEKARQRLLQLKKEGDLVFAVGEERRQIADYLKGLIEQLYPDTPQLDEHRPSAPSAPSSSPKRDRPTSSPPPSQARPKGTRPPRQKGGNILNDRVSAAL